MYLKLSGAICPEIFAMDEVKQALSVAYGWRSYQRNE